MPQWGILASTILTTVVKKGIVLAQIQPNSLEFPITHEPFYLCRENSWKRILRAEIAIFCFDCVKKKSNSENPQIQ